MPADVAPLLLVVAASAVILGTVLQRVSGMGVGLVVSPTLTLLLGPVTGVLLTNVTTIISAALIGITLRHGIDWQRYRRLAPLIVVGSLPGALLVGVLTLRVADSYAPDDAWRAHERLEAGGTRGRLVIDFTR